MNAAFEQAMIAVLRGLRPEEIDLEQLFSDDGIRESIESRDLGHALQDLALALDVDDRADRFSATQAFVLAVEQREDEAVNEGLERLGRRLLSPFPEAAERVEGFVNLTATLSVHTEVTPDVVDGLRIIFGDDLTGAERTDQSVTFTGAAADFVTMFIEFVFNFPRCRLVPGSVEVGGQPEPATLVELQACTGRSFDRCKHAIDPRNWKECNPYFFRVIDIIDPVDAPDGWAGVIREQVGPWLSEGGMSWTTNLSVRTLTRPRISAVTYELAPLSSRYPAGDGSVIVDHGFLSVTDQGSHRQIRILKVYRVTNIQWPQPFICPLWALQAAQAAWWC